MELIFGLVIFSHVWLLVGEFVEFFDEGVQDLLFAILSLEVSQVLSLHIVEELLDVFALHSLLAQGLHHLFSVADTGLFPKGHQDTFEVVINVVSAVNKVISSEL